MFFSFFRLGKVTLGMFPLCGGNQKKFIKDYDNRQDSAFL
jgi:hypothetical protein